jgi:hypothetical protein
MLKYFTEHPKENGMNYLTHFIFAVRISLGLIAVATKGIVHAFLPFIFKTSISDHIKELNKKL